MSGSVASPYVFLSYASVDRERALALADALERAGVSVWVDRRSIGGGSSWNAEIVRGIEQCAALLLRTSAAAVASRNVQRELQLAVEFDRPILPLRLEAVEYPAAMRYALAGVQWVDALGRPPEAWLPEVLHAPALVDVVRQQPSAASPEPVAAMVSGRTPLPAALAVDERTAFVGRDREVAQLEAAYARARGGQCQVVLLAGEPGIGKTRLASEFARAACRDGATVLLGTCDEEIGVPYQPFVEALQQYLRSLPPESLRAQTGGRGELGRLVPELAGHTGDAGSPSAASPEMQRYHLFEAVGGLLTTASTAAPLVLLLEDLHWAEKPTLLLLKHLARSAQGAALLVIGTYRETELSRSHPLTEVLADLRRERYITRVTLRGLDGPAVASLMDAWAGEPAPAPIAEAVYAETEGVPFFVEEVLQHLGESGAIGAGGRWRTDISVDEMGIPEGVREVVGRRLSRLSESCNLALTVAAVIGREFSAALLGRVVDMSGDELIRALEEALAARLVGEVPRAPDRYSFAHAFIRQTLYEEISTIRLVGLHRRIGQALEEMHRPGDPVALDALAHHFFEAAPGGDATKAVEYATRAGDHAADALAYEEAARHYGRALQVLEQLDPAAGHGRAAAELRAKRGGAFVAVGLWADARPDLEAALAGLPEEGVERRAELLVQLATVGYWLLDSAGPFTAADEALGLARRAGRHDLAADALSWRASAEGTRAPDIPTAARALQDAVEEIGPRDNLALRLLPNFLYLMGKTDEAVRMSAVGGETVAGRPDVSRTLYALSSRGLALAGAGRYREAVDTFGELRAFGSRYGVRTLLARGIACSGGMYRDLYDYGRAEAIEREAREMALGFGFLPTAVQSGIDLVFILARSGRIVEAAQVLAETSDMLAGMKGWHADVIKCRFLAAAAEVAVARNDRDDAPDATWAAVAEARATARPKYEALALRLRAEALLELGRPAEAIADLRAAVALARPVGDPAMTLHATAALLAVEPAEDLAREARAALDRITAELPDDELRRHFEAAEPVRLVRRLSG